MMCLHIYHLNCNPNQNIWENGIFLFFILFVFQVAYFFTCLEMSLFTVCKSLVIFFLLSMAVLFSALMLLSFGCKVSSDVPNDFYAS